MENGQRGAQICESEGKEHAVGGGMEAKGGEGEGKREVEEEEQDACPHLEAGREPASVVAVLQLDAQVKEMLIVSGAEGYLRERPSPAAPSFAPRS